MKKIVSATIGLLFLAALAGNVSAGKGGEMGNAGSGESSAQKMSAGDALKVQEKVRQQMEQQIQVNKKADADQVGSKNRVRTNY